MNDSLLSCVYCSPEKVAKFAMGEGSEEHVLIAALGGKKVTRNLCCKACNNRLGKELDAEFSRVFSPLANMFSIKRARKGDAPTLATEETIEGHQLEILPGLKYSLRGSKVTEHKREDGSIELRVSANTREGAERLMANYMKKFEGKKVSVGGQRFVSKSTAAPLFSASLKIEEVEKRCAAKMMLALLATSTAPATVRSESLRDLVGYINGSLQLGSKFEPWLNVSLPERKPVYDFGHALMVVTDKERSLLIGALQIYGTISITGVLSECWNGPNVGTIYWLDPVSGSGETFKFTADDIGRSYPRQERPSSAEYQESMSLMMKEIQHRHLAALWEEFIDGLARLKSSNLSDDQKEKAANSLIESHVMNIMRIDHERELP